jgi:phospholipase/carboxylesterase
LSEITDLIRVGPDETGLAHYAHIPPATSLTAPAPVVVMVHGWAGNEESMWTFSRVAPQTAAIVTPRGPVILEEGGFTWFNYDRHEELLANPDSLQAAQEKFSRFLDRLPALYPIDPLQVVLVGFSQGAMLCNQFVINHPDRVVGVASLAGAVPEPPHHPQSNRLAGVPVFVAHGVRDEVVPVAQARLTHRIFTALGAEVTYGEYPAAHKLHVQGLRDLKAWLARFFG